MKAKASENNSSRSAAGARRRTPREDFAPTVAVTVTFRHIEPTMAIRRYAERKLNHAATRLKRACSIHLILTIDKYRHQGEVTVKSGRFAMIAHEETKDLYAVIDGLADKVSRQLKTNLAKIESRRMRAVSAGEILADVEGVSTVRERIETLGHNRF